MILTSDFRDNRWVLFPNEKLECRIFKIISHDIKLTEGDFDLCKNLSFTIELEYPWLETKD